MNEVVSRPKADMIAQQRLAYVLLAITAVIAVIAGKHVEKSNRQMLAAEAAKVDAEEKRDKALKKAALIIESSPWAMIICDEHGVITNTNAAVEKMLGWSHEEMIGKQSEFLVIPQEFRAVHEKAIAEAAQKLREYSGDYLQTSNRRAVKALTKSGAEIDAVASIRAIKDGDEIEFILSLGQAKPPAEGPLKLQPPERISDVEQNIAKKNPEYSAWINQPAEAK